MPRSGNGSLQTEVHFPESKLLTKIIKDLIEKQIPDLK